MWKEGEPAQARYHALLEVGGKVYPFYTLELNQLFSRAHDLGEYLRQEGIKEYCLINGYRLVDTPREKNARCPCDFLTKEESEQFKETLERVLKRSYGK